MASCSPVLAAFGNVIPAYALYTTLFQPQQLKQCRVQRPACTTAVLARTDVNRHVDRPTVAGTLMVPARVGVARDDALALEDQPGKACREVAHAARDFERRRRRVLERDQ